MNTRSLTHLVKAGTKTGPVAAAGAGSIAECTNPELHHAGHGIRRSQLAHGLETELYDSFVLADPDDERHDQSKAVNSVSATAECNLFRTTVQGSVPTDA